MGTLATIKSSIKSGNDEYDIIYSKSGNSDEDYFDLVYCFYPADKDKPREQRRAGTHWVSVDKAEGLKAEFGVFNSEHIIDSSCSYMEFIEDYNVRDSKMIADAYAKKHSRDEAIKVANQTIKDYPAITSFELFTTNTENDDMGIFAYSTEIKYKINYDFKLD